MNKVCLEHDWRDRRAYDFIASLPGDACAWEVLRRRPNYQGQWYLWRRRQHRAAEPSRRLSVKRSRKRQPDAEAEGIHLLRGPAAERLESGTLLAARDLAARPAGDDRGAR